jgi:hypothetical protein
VSDPGANEGSVRAFLASAARQGVCRHLTYNGRWHRTPGRHGRMLPQRLNRVLFWPSLGKYFIELRREHVFGRPRQAEVMLGTYV